MTTVVVVDDYAGFRTMVRELLRDGSFRVVGEAATGGQALPLIRRLAPELVLLDVQLPDLDGFAVAAALREAGATMCVVLCSVRVAADYGGRVRTCGADAFITKSALSADALRAAMAAR